MFLSIRRLATLGILAALLAVPAAFGQDLVVAKVTTQEFGNETEKAARTRMELMMLMRQHPPRLGEILKLDPTLLSNDAYMAPYPEVKAFLQRHPEIARDPDYFFGSFTSELNELKRRAVEAETAARYDRSNRSGAEVVFDVLVPFAIFFAVVGILAWLIKRFQQHRQWLRVWRTQSEAHSRLMERMTTNEDLLAYLNSPAGKRFFESSWVPVDATPAPASVPAGRIIWSVQAGLLLLLGGISLRFVYGDTRLTPDDLVTLNILSVVGIGLGVSFIVGAAASFVISAKLGLIDHAAPPRRTTSIIEPPSST
jgi:hypothetical protein